MERPSVCTLFEWRDQYAAAAAATYPPTPGRNPLGAPSRDTLLDAVVDAAFVAVRRATPLPSVGTVQSVDAVAPARALLAGLPAEPAAVVELSPTEILEAAEELKSPASSSST